MKKTVVFLGTFILSGTLGGLWYLYANFHPYLAGQEFMSVESAEKKWGQKAFDAIKFQNAPMSERAGMAVDLIKKKTYLNQPLERVIKEMGPRSGYFISERIPTYFVVEGWEKNENSWQLVFLPDRNGNIVEDVRIHKNCCSSDIWKNKGIIPPKD